MSIDIEERKFETMKLMIPITIIGRKEPLSRKRFWISNLILWLYTIVWLILLFSVWYLWDVPLGYKLAVNLILILGTPALSDLIKPYEKYKKEWAKKNKWSENLKGESGTGRERDDLK